MTVFLNKGNYIFAFCSENVPVISVKPGEELEVEICDSFSDQVQKPEDVLDAIDWDRVNPAAGPVYVDGAEPGDVLKVVIEEINIGSQGVIAAGEDLGVLGHRLKGLKSKLIPIRGDKAVFDDNLQIPVKPMIGVIGVAPSTGGINTGTPGAHGGNMDNTMVGAGAVLYFPIFVKGALFALGDIHAVMGDGEIGVAGVEIGAKVRLKLDVVKGLNINNPILENEEVFTTVASAESLDDAVKQATEDMADILLKKLPMQLYEIAMLMSVAGHTQICQVVDPLKTARFVIPKWVLNRYGFKFE